MIFEDDRVVIDENSGEHCVAFLTNNGDDLTFSITTDRPNVFKTLSVETDQRVAGVSPANFFQSINLTLIADQKAAVRSQQPHDDAADANAARGRETSTVPVLAI